MEYLSIFWQSMTITLFVLSMMLIIDYLNVFSKGIWSKNLKNKVWTQILFAAFLGVIPGCLGAYTAVSLYVHNIFSTGALVAAMIATSGDEAFFMFSIIPEKAILIQMILFFVAVISGFVVVGFSRKKVGELPVKHFHIHEEAGEFVVFDRKHFISQLIGISKTRLLLIIALLISFLLVIFNFDSLLHGFEMLGHEHEEAEHAHPKWVSITYLIVLIITFFIILTASDHFLQDHLWHHIIRKHLLRIFLWTTGTLLVVHLLDHYFTLGDLISENLYIVLIVAVLVGIIPESGPHLIFILLFASGTLPLSILLANSISQDGHGSLPLIAESPKGFIKIKAINVLVGFLVGIIGLLFGI